MFWLEFGGAYLNQSHEYSVENMRLGCVAIKMEDFKSNFRETVAAVLRVYGVAEGAIPELVYRMRGADGSVKSLEERRQDAHFTAERFSPEFVAEVSRRLMQMPDVFRLVNQQRLELGY
jgi:hypothetical protein